ncbi:hypothetical protein OIO90_003368 [Microbotryomycetes sp. JL221]|nr:hypothetical protein OIO90_003368 [Microbotryomycetes sp. JL221]
MAHLHVSPAPAIVTRHAPPELNKLSGDLRWSYSPSRDGIDSNLLVLMHGLGDTMKPFAQLGQSLNLPQTAVLTLQAPHQIPLLEEEAFAWWPSFTELGELIPNPNPSKTVTLLIKLIEHLTSSEPGPAWQANQLHLFGFAQGGSCAAELALSWSRHVRIQQTPTTIPKIGSPSQHTSASKASTSDETLQLGSIVAVSAPLLSHPSIGSQKCGTKVLLVSRRGEDRLVGSGSWRKAFENVKDIVLSSGQSQSMLRGQAEWIEVMRFWSETLVRRSQLELSGELYTINSGVVSAPRSS